MIEHIPVVANGDFQKLIGRAKIEDTGDLVIRISKEQLLRELAYLITIDQVRYLTIGVGYVATEPKEPNDRSD